MTIDQQREGRRVTASEHCANVDALAQRFLDIQCEQSPMTATAFGISGYEHLAPNVSLEADDALRARYVAVAREAGAIDPTALDATRATTRLMLLQQARDAVARLDAAPIEYGANAFQGPQTTVLMTLPQTRVRDADQGSAYLSRLRGMATYLDDAAGRLQAGSWTGRRAVGRLARSAVGQIDRYLEMDDDPLVGPVRGRPEEETAVATVREVVRPAMLRLRDAMIADVLPVARPDDLPGVCHIPGGDAVYAIELASHTTTSLSAEEVHAIGREVVAELDGEYAALGHVALGVSNPSDVRRQLRGDPALRFSSRDEVLATAVEATARAAAVLPQAFNLLPDHHCTVEVTPEVEAPTTTVGYYRQPSRDRARPGAYFVNTWRPETRTRYEAEALAFHEGVPGHHLQICVSQQARELPAFRANGYVTAHAEGWALYAERLADELGLYNDDLSRLGMLSFDSWRACRLVVDTGIHALGWTRDEAVRYLTDNTALSVENIANEVDRYIAWPGQACAYMIGRCEIVRLRTSCEAAFGPRFDLAAFHDVMLGQGAVPLAVLDHLVADWTATRLG